MASPATAERRSTIQEQLVMFLLDPRSHPHHPSRVRLIQTHASFVFIAPPFVFKIKKPVNFGFLDFSTLEKRRHFCEREVELNRRLAPDVYLGVVPISSTGHGFVLGRDDAVVEYAVKMRHLSPRYFLNRLVERGAVQPADLDRIAAALRDFYRTQHPTKEIEAWGRVDRLRLSTDENFRQTAAFIGHTLSLAAFATIRRYTDGFYARHADLFQERVHRRWIRDCHGDLHLDHIHLSPRRLTIYDCIEFNDRFRYVDVANDLAFLAMDLDFEGRPDLARHFIRRMAAELDDPGLAALIDFYKCYRAYVRGKVESLHSLAPTAPESERRIGAARARRYFQRALQYVVAGSEPLVVAVMGRIASGKSALSQALADSLGWTRYSSDRIRKELAGLPLHQRAAATTRNRLYKAAMTDRTYRRLLEQAVSETSEGRCAVLDATFGQRSRREELRGQLAKRGIVTRFIEVHAGEETTRRRLRERDARTDEISDARLEDYDLINRHYEAPGGLEDTSFARVDAGGALDRTLGCALEQLRRLQEEAPCPIR